MLYFLTDFSKHPLKPNFTSIMGTRNYIKYSGIKKYLNRKTNLTRHECEVCIKPFKNEMMKDFHKQVHHRQHDVKRGGLNISN